MYESPSLASVYRINMTSYAYYHLVPDVGISSWNQADINEQISVLYKAPRCDGDSWEGVRDQNSPHMF